MCDNQGGGLVLVLQLLLFIADGFRFGMDVIHSRYSQDVLLFEYAEGLHIMFMLDVTHLGVQGSQKLLTLKYMLKFSH